MRFGTLCSGIEGAAVALQPLGWQLVFSSEIDKFCCALLASKYPRIPNYGDITKIETIPAIDALISGTPCQSFSVTGARRGMDDNRGKLAIAFASIVRKYRPRWVIWENVPGVLSSNGGRDFGTFLWHLAECGYGVVYRVLDAQYFGVPQRRRRVFVVGYLGSWQRAAAVLFECPPRPNHVKPVDEAPCGQQPASPITTETCYGWADDATPKFGLEMCPTLRAHQGGFGVGLISETEYRKLSISEWEILQGFPVGYTELAGYGDRQRRAALGNSFCIPVVRWIGSRISTLEDQFYGTRVN